MRPTPAALILILGLLVSALPATAQRAGFLAERWTTTGAGLSTPLGFNVGASYSATLAGPLFVQAAATASKDFYVTKHSAIAFGPALGLRHYTDVALLTFAAGPTYVRGARGLDLSAPGAGYETASLQVAGQVLWREVNMGFELYTNVNAVRTVSGMRLIYRLGQLR